MPLWVWYLSTLAGNAWATFVYFREQSKTVGWMCPDITLGNTREILWAYACSAFWHPFDVVNIVENKVVTTNKSIAVEAVITCAVQILRHAIHKYSSLRCVWNSESKLFSFTALRASAVHKRNRNTNFLQVTSVMSLKMCSTKMFDWSSKAWLQLEMLLILLHCFSFLVISKTLCRSPHLGIYIKWNFE